MNCTMQMSARAYHFVRGPGVTIVLSSGKGSVGSNDALREFRPEPGGALETSVTISACACWSPSRRCSSLPCSRRPEPRRRHPRGTRSSPISGCARHHSAAGGGCGRSTGRRPFASTERARPPATSLNWTTWARARPTSGSHGSVATGTLLARGFFLRAGIPQFPELARLAVTRAYVRLDTPGRPVAIFSGSADRHRVRGGTVLHDPHPTAQRLRRSGDGVRGRLHAAVRPRDAVSPRRRTSEGISSRAAGS